MVESNLLEALIQAFKQLPGVGLKSASRMAFHLMQNDRPSALQLAIALKSAADSIKHCQQCNTLTQFDLCSTCSDHSRDNTILCVIETPADQYALERTGAYKGLYFVLMGKLSPLDGIGPLDIGIKKLFDRAINGSIQEVILATNFTAEGEATAHVISQGLRVKGIRVTRLSRGVPIGSELEYVDLGTIAHALIDRR